MREWRSGNVGAFQVHVESSILSSRTKPTASSIDESILDAVFVSASLCRRVRNSATKRLHHLHKTRIEIDGHAKSATYFEGGKAVDQTA